MTDAPADAFGELRSLAAAPPSRARWDALLELVRRSQAGAPARHAEAVEPYMLGALRRWPPELRRARLIEDPAHVIALAKTLVVACDDDGPTPDVVESHLLRELDATRRARITRLDLLTCVHRPLAVLDALTRYLPSITRVYANVYYDPDARRAKRRERLHTLESVHVVDAILDAWAPQLEGLGLSSFGVRPPGQTANDYAWDRVLRELDRLPALRALELAVQLGDTERWDQVLLSDPRLAALEEVTLELSDADVYTEVFGGDFAPRGLSRLKITNCPSTTARELLASAHLASVRQWELFPGYFVRAPIEWGTRLGAYWAARSAACPQTLGQLFASRWLNLLDLNAAQTRDVLFDGKRARASDVIEGVSLRHISPRDLKRFLRAIPTATPNLRHLHVHDDLNIRPVDVRAMDAAGLADQLESLRWRPTHATSRQMTHGAGSYSEGCRAEWYELVASEDMHPALRQRAWRCATTDLSYKDSYVALAKAMGLKGLSSKTIAQLDALIAAAAPSCVREPLLLDAPTPPELLG